MLIQITGERVQALSPEFFITRKPRGSVVHRLGQERALYYASFFRTANQPGAREHAQVFHEAGQRHIMWLCELRDWQVASAQGFQHRSARGIGKRTEHGVETIKLMLNHKVQYEGEEMFLSRQQIDQPGPSQIRRVNLPR